MTAEAAGTHPCPATGCQRRVPADQLACRTHWYRVSRATQDRVWDAWQFGSFAEHRAAMLAAIDEMNALSSPPAGGLW